MWSALEKEGKAINRSVKTRGTGIVWSRNLHQRRMILDHHTLKSDCNGMISLPTENLFIQHTNKLMGDTIQGFQIIFLLLSSAASIQFSFLVTWCWAIAGHLYLLKICSECSMSSLLLVWVSWQFSFRLSYYQASIVSLYLFNQ